MRSEFIVLIIGILFVLLTDTALFLLVKKYLKRKIFIYLYWLQSLPFIGGLIAYHLTIRSITTSEAYYWFGLLIGILFLFYAPKLLYIIIGCIARLSQFIKPIIGSVINKIAIVTAGACFIIILYSITWGRHNFKVETQHINFTNLPKAFDGLRIVQLSDLHLGSYGKGYKGISKLVTEVNALHPDLILFTGDMVNNFASEMPLWMDELSRLQAKYGKYAVTGNHDYGDYVQWSNPEDKEQNMLQFYEYMEKIGFHMLSNTNVPFVIEHDTLYIGGVENWGKPPFPKYGDIDRALKGTDNHFTILLSHDPSHWRAEIIDTPVSLTLSGHTHAMQMGIKIGKWEWSPAQYIYPEYDGLYESGEQFLYISRGQGYLGFPGRIGLRPTISEIILNNKK